MGIYRIDTLNTGHGSRAFVGGIFWVFFYIEAVLTCWTVGCPRDCICTIALSIYATMSFPLNPNRLIWTAVKYTKRMLLTPQSGSCDWIHVSKFLLREQSSSLTDLQPNRAHKGKLLFYVPFAKFHCFMQASCQFASLVAVEALISAF